MNGGEFLFWVRGTGLSIALVIFGFGMMVRLLEILVLGRGRNLAELRQGGSGPALRTLVRRFLPPDGNTLRRSMVTVVAGYGFHIGLLLALFLLAPHIQLFQSLLGFGWPALPTPVIDLLAVIALLSLVVLLWHRVGDPVLRYLSTGEDYLMWVATFLPLMSGYLAYHHLWLPYEWMLGTHILSVELLLILFPFTRLTHAFTLFIARWYNGAMAGERGVSS